MIELTLYRGHNDTKASSIFVNPKDITLVVDGHDQKDGYFPWTNVSVMDNETGKEIIYHVFESAKAIGRMIQKDLRGI